MQFGQKTDEVPAPAQPVEPPDHHRVESSPSRISQYGVERRATIFGTAYRLIDVLDGLPPTRLHVAVQLRQLILDGLLRRALTLA